MTQANSNSRSRLLAIGILVIVILLFVTLFVNPYMYLHEKSKDHAESVALQLERNNKMLAKKEFYLDEIDRLDNDYSADEIYLQSTKKALASAEIQQILKRLSSRNKVELVSSQPISSETSEDNKVGLRVRVRTNIVGLQKLLYGLEAGSPKLFVDELLIQQSSRALVRFDNNESANQKLNVNLQVYGYLNKS